jgi:pimeloyl-ACP methyl ester carboxylesterase
VDHVVSRDGTPIAYERAGTGPVVVLVGGGLDDGTENAPLVPELARRFTVVNHARRGRGGSGDTAPYALAREIEDIGALMNDGPAHLFGASSGGALALEAAAAGLAVDRIAVYEVPYMSDEESVRRWSDYTGRLTAALAAGRRAEALELFMRLAGSSDDQIAGARDSPYWPGLMALAPTLAYDAACLGDGRPPVARLGTITRPVLVATGRTAGGPGFFDEAADAVAAALPAAERRTIDGQGHVADPKVLASVLTEFFTR